MAELLREQITSDLTALFNETMDDWEYSGEITPETRIFADLGLESIDLVALGGAIEEHYRRTFPFAQWLTQMRDQQVDDVRVKDVIQFLYENLQDASFGESS